MRKWSEEAGSDLRRSVRLRLQRIGRPLRILGILCILAALAIGGYTAWLLWGTGLTTARVQAELRPRIQRVIDTKDPSAPGADRVRVPGDAIGILIIPRIDLDMVVVEGTDTGSLKKGPGHYTGTAYPWDAHGTVAIAGHRTTYLHPFYHLDALRKGDPITIETEFGTFRYTVTRTEITSPDDGSVLDQTALPSLVLTTCNPRYSAAQRLIVFARRVED
jgi:sortase A